MANNKTTPELEELRAIRGLLTILATHAVLDIKSREERAHVLGDAVAPSLTGATLGAVALLTKFGTRV